MSDPVTEAELHRIDREVFTTELEKRLLAEVRRLRSVLGRIENPLIGISGKVCNRIASKALNEGEESNG
jgi:hypothetical protein